LIARDPVTGAEQIIDTEVVRRGIHLGNASLSLISLGGANWTGAYPAYPGLNYRNAYPWDWAVCHAGTWIRREHRYVWVAGRKRHHRRPIHWVKVGGTKGYVPIHPRDVAGKPPVNLKDGFFAMRKDDAVERIAFDPKATVKVLDGAPKEFNKEYFAPLERAVAPKMEARSAGNGMMVGHSALAQPAKVPIVFDAKTQSFSVARQVVEGGKTTTVVRSIASAQARGDYGGGGTAGASGRSESTGRSEGASGGGYSRAASGGGGYSGGGGGGGAAIHSAPSGGGGGGAAAGGTHH